MRSTLFRTILHPPHIPASRNVAGRLPFRAASEPVQIGRPLISGPLPGNLLPPVRPWSADSFPPIGCCKIMKNPQIERFRQGFTAANKRENNRSPASRSLPEPPGASRSFPEPPGGLPGNLLMILLTTLYAIDTFPDNPTSPHIPASWKIAGRLPFRAASEPVQIGRPLISGPLPGNLLPPVRLRSADSFPLIGCCKIN